MLAACFVTGKKVFFMFIRNSSTSKSDTYAVIILVRLAISRTSSACFEKRILLFWQSTIAYDLQEWKG